MIFKPEEFVASIRSIFINKYNELRIWVKLSIALIADCVLIYLCMLGNFSPSTIVALSLITVGVWIVFSISDEEVVWIIGIPSCICISIILLIGSLCDAHKTQTERYEPTCITHTKTMVVIEYGRNSITSKDIAIYNASKITMCKDMTWNGFNSRLADKWYICGE